MVLETFDSLTLNLPLSFKRYVNYFDVHLVSLLTFSVLQGQVVVVDSPMLLFPKLPYDGIPGANPLERRAAVLKMLRFAMDCVDDEGAIVFYCPSYSHEGGFGVSHVLEEGKKLGLHEPAHRGHLTIVYDDQAGSQVSSSLKLRV